MATEVKKTTESAPFTIGESSDTMVKLMSNRPSLTESVKNLINTSFASITPDSTPASAPRSVITPASYWDALGSSMGTIDASNHSWVAPLGGPEEGRDNTMDLGMYKRS